MNKEELLTSIEEAFATAPKPAWDEIVPHDCEECHVVRDDFAHYEWSCVPDETLEFHYDNLPLLSERALRYDLPAYMRYALDHLDADLTQFLFFHLAPNTVNETRWQKGGHVFTAQEKAAIYHFLDDVKRSDWDGEYQDDIDRGLQMWSQPA